MSAGASNPVAVSDVVIVGGGIMGTSCALFLRRRGLTVTLVEQGLVGQQASGTNFGNVRRQGRPLMQLPLANRAIANWRRMKELVGCDVEYLQVGHVRVCYRDRPELVDEFERYAREARTYDLELDVLTGAAMRRQFPYLGKEVLAASFSRNDGHANPRLVSPALARAAQRAGAAVFEHTRIVHVEKDGTDFRVTSEDGRVFRAPVLAITAGAWGNRLSAQFGEPVDLTARGPTMCVSEPVPYSIHPSTGVFTPVEQETVYFRQIPRGNVIIGGGTRGAAYPDLCRAYVRPENTLSQLAQIQRLAPSLGRLNIIRVWSGIEGYTPDGQAVLGASEQVSGLFYGFGFSGSGFQVGPGVGETLAELIHTGTTAIPVEAYRMSRFAGSAAGVRREGLAR
jgi:sarcosine oxidase subunit beta